VRFRGGNNTTPDCSKFRHTLKSVFTNQLLCPSDFGNCNLDCSEFSPAKQEIEGGRHVIFRCLPHNTQPVCLTGELCNSAVSANSSFYVTASSSAVPSHRLSTYGRRAFATAGPTTWNSLPTHLRRVNSTAAFGRSLKTHLFSEY